MSSQSGGLTVIFGGAFDPIHFGHIKPVFELLEHPEIKQVRFLPCGMHPNKQIEADNEHRAAMLALIAQSDKVAVDTTELQCDEVSYTSKTLEGIRKEIGADTPLAFLLGQDAFLNIADWHSCEKIPNLAHLIVLSRNSDDIPDNHPFLSRCGGWSSLQDLLGTPAGKLHLFGNRTIDLSSSKVRRRLSYGEEPRYLLPSMIWKYIQRHHLYGV